ncbi:MAG: hypothetical protein LBV71_15020 [Prevotella sp.]|jgi:hypothetical protein|nr:hypothetical protein [Prevotella sp.]
MKKKLALIIVGIVLIVNTASPVCGTLYCPGGAPATYYCSGAGELETLQWVDEIYSFFC